jgi:hypothetical protein
VFGKEKSDVLVRRVSSSGAVSLNEEYEDEEEYQEEEEENKSNINNTFDEMNDRAENDEEEEEEEEEEENEATDDETEHDTAHNNNNNNNTHNNPSRTLDLIQQEKRRHGQLLDRQSENSTTLKKLHQENEQLRAKRNLQQENFENLKTESTQLSQQQEELKQQFQAVITSRLEKERESGPSNNNNNSSVFVAGKPYLFLPNSSSSSSSSLSSTSAIGVEIKKIMKKSGSFPVPNTLFTSSFSSISSSTSMTTSSLPLLLSSPNMQIPSSSAVSPISPVQGFALRKIRLVSKSKRLFEFEENINKMKQRPACSFFHYSCSFENIIPSICDRSESMMTIQQLKILLSLKENFVLPTTTANNNNQHYHMMNVFKVENMQNLTGLKLAKKSKRRYSFTPNLEYAARLSAAFQTILKKFDDEDEEFGSDDDEAGASNTTMKNTEEERTENQHLIRVSWYVACFSSVYPLILKPEFKDNDEALLDENFPQQQLLLSAASSPQGKLRNNSSSTKTSDSPPPNRSTSIYHDETFDAVASPIIWTSTSSRHFPEDLQDTNYFEMNFRHQRKQLIKMGVLLFEDLHFFDEL